MTAVESVLLLVLVPLAILGVLALLTLRPKFARAPRYRPDQDWEHPPVWWTATPDAVGSRAPAELDRTIRTARGGAGGSW
ncbi:MAG: hypothetical protein M3291_12115 [Actinomycetota bacterium]|nr:hypothetical protein [Actinomycetota bacterium]